MGTIGGLIEAGEVQLSTLSDALDTVPSGGIAYLPTASYRVMEGWSLPPEAAPGKPKPAAEPNLPKR